VRGHAPTVPVTGVQTAESAILPYPLDRKRCARPAARVA